METSGDVLFAIHAGAKVCLDVRRCKATDEALDRVVLASAQRDGLEVILSSKCVLRGKNDGIDLGGLDSHDFRLLGPAIVVPSEVEVGPLLLEFCKRCCPFTCRARREISIPQGVVYLCWRKGGSVGWRRGREKGRGKRGGRGKREQQSKTFGCSRNSCKTTPLLKLTRPVHMHIFLHDVERLDFLQKAVVALSLRLPQQESLRVSEREKL